MKDGSKRWHVTSSLVACPKPRMKKVLSQFETVGELVGDATLVCGLPLPHYVDKKCCKGDGHIENFGDEDYTEVNAQVRETARACLETVFPGAIIFTQWPPSAGAMTLRIQTSCSAPTVCPSGQKVIRCT